MALPAPVPSAPFLSPDEPDKDRPLRDDIRLLGRILGDTVREQEGEEIFDLVEQIRQASIRFHRDNEAGARRELEATLDSLTADQTLAIVRAFSYFSHLANIAEDQHHIRRNRAHAIGGLRAAARLARLRLPAHAARRASSRAALGAFFDRALVSPVLTAHPTEVRRKSTLDPRARDRRTARRARPRRRDPAELDARSRSKLRRAVLILWRTNMLRQTRLKVIDEVANGLSYLRLHVLPRAAAPLRRDRGRARRLPAEPPARSAIPLVPAHRLVDRRRPRRQSLRHRRRARRGDAAAERARARPSISTNCTSSAANCRSPPASPRSRPNSPRSPSAPPTIRCTRRDEPYRRAITGMYSRLAKTARDLDHVVALRQPIVDAPPYATAAEFAADLDVIAASLTRERRRRSSRRGRLRALAPRRRRVRLPSRADRPAAEFRRARAHGRGAARRRLAGPRLSKP